MPVAALVGAVLLLAPTGPSAEARRAEAFEAELLAELARVAPQAVEEARAAGVAYRGGRWQEAFDGYARVLAAAPGFPHALRRQCNARLALGDRAKALPLCRAALQAGPGPLNQMALAWALAHRRGGAAPPAADQAEGRRLARAAFDATPSDPELAGMACQVALDTGAEDLLSAASARLLALAPGELATELCAFFAAATRERFGEARRHLRAAREAGLPPEAAAALGARLDEAEPAWSRWGGTALAALGAWAALLALLLLAGVALSAITLRGARRLASSRGATSGGGGLRAVYRAVLWLTCAAYYLSLPLVVLLVVGAGYGLWLAFAAVGRIPVKLAVVAALVVLVSLWAVAKSLWASLVRSKDEDPGLRTDTAGHPRFAAVLAEAASRVGTRGVDAVFLTPGTDAAVYERGGLVRQLAGRTERCLILGVGLLDGMTQGQLKAVLAHEYGHFVNRDTAGGGLALAVRRSVLQMAGALAAGGAAVWYNPAWLFVTNFHKLFLRVSQGASRLQEILADRWAALAYGGAAFAGGLTHAVGRAVRFDRHASATLREVVDGGLALQNLYTYAPASPVEPSEVEAEVAKAMAAEPSPYDSHPRPADRIAWVGDLPSAHGGDPHGGEPAWDLFTDRDALERTLTDVVRENVARNHGVRIPVAPAEPVSE